MCLTICSMKVDFEVLGDKEYMENFQIIWLETLGEDLNLGTFILCM